MTSRAMVQLLKKRRPQAMMPELMFELSNSGVTE
jgi:hypothetical protein